MAWDATVGRVVTWQKNSWVDLCRGEAPRVAAAAFVDTLSTVEIIDAANSRILQQDGSARGRCVIETHWIDEEVVAAARYRDGWIVGAIDPAGNTRVLALSKRGLGRVVVGFDTGIPLREGHLTAARDHIVIADSEWPFEHEIFSASGKRLSRGTPFAGEQWLIANGDTISAPQTRALPIYELDRGFVQLIADLASDRRFLTLYDSAMHPMRWTVLEAPFGILATDPKTRTLLALRKTRVAEIVVYRWSWITSS